MDERSPIHAELPRQPPLDRCYREPHRVQVLDFLLHLGPYTNDVLFVLGAKGSGKTTLIRQFLSRVAESWRVAYVSADKYATPDDIAHAASEAWGAQQELAASNGILSDVSKRAGDARDRGQRPILVIDEAHYLSDVTLNWLAQGCESAQRNKDSLGLIICGEPELFLSPASAKLRTLPHHHFELITFDRRQTAALVAQQCEVLGFPAETLDAASVTSIFQQAKGNLGHSVELIAQALHARTAPEEHDRALQVSATAPTVAVSAAPAPLRPASAKAVHRRRWGISVTALWRVSVAVIVGALIAAALWFQEDINKLVASSTSVLPTKAATSLPYSDDESAMFGIPPLLESSSLSSSEISELNKIPSSNGLESELSTFLPPVAAPPDADTLQVDTAAPAFDTPLATENQNLATAPVAEPLVEPSVSVPDSITPPSPPSDAFDAPVVSTVPAKPPGNIAGVRNETWLVEQPAGSFTVQLLALNKEHVLRKVLKKLPDTGEMAYYRFQRGDNYLYGLLFGVYPTYEAAQQARARIPKALGPVQPWVRKMSVVQEEIRRAGVVPVSTPPAPPVSKTPVPASDSSLQPAPSPAPLTFLE